MHEIRDKNEKVLLLHWCREWQTATRELSETQTRLSHWQAKADSARAELDRVLLEVKAAGGPDITADQITKIDVSGFTADPDQPISIECKEQ